MPHRRLKQVLFPVRIDRPLSVLVSVCDLMLGANVHRMVEELGCSSKHAHNLSSARRLLSQEAFDVLITDTVHPSGVLDLLAELRGQDQRSDYLHVLVIAPRGDDDLVFSAIEAGADDVLYSPIDPTRLALELGTARRVVNLERRLHRRSRHLSAASRRVREAYVALRADLAAAADMQRRLLPAPRLDGAFRFNWLFQPSSQVGGDSLGVIQLSNRKFLFLNIDVAGHGVPAALSSFAVHNRLTQIAPCDQEQLGYAAALINEELLAQEQETYLTTIFGLAEPEGERVSFIRAGHPMPLVIRAQDDARLLEDGGFPLGLLPTAPQNIVEVELRVGDRILFYSDGVIDGGGAGRFSEADLIAFCNENRSASTSVFLKKLEETLGRLRDRHPPEDDISVLLIERGED